MEAVEAKRYEKIANQLPNRTKQQVGGASRREPASRDHNFNLLKNYITYIIEFNIIFNDTNFITIASI